jgi:hypothetical protein
MSSQQRIRRRDRHRLWESQVPLNALFRFCFTHTPPRLPYQRCQQLLQSLCQPHSRHVAHERIYREPSEVVHLQRWIAL